jgi:hypothetical protein
LSSIGIYLENVGLTERPNFYTGDQGRKDHGSEGLFQWRLDRLTAGKEWARKQGRNWNDIDTQIDYFAEGPDPDRRVDMEAWKRTRSIEEGNRLGQQFERYGGGLQQRRARDAEKVMKVYEDQHNIQTANPLRIAPDFHKRLDEIRAAKPLAPWQHSMNEIHDHRIVQSETNIHVASASPRDLTTGPLGRPKNADLIRNTSSYAS